MSFAPSPTASADAASMPCAASVSSRVRRFVAAPTIGVSTVPVSLPPETTSRLAPAPLGLRLHDDIDAVERAFKSEAGGLRAPAEEEVAGGIRLDPAACEGVGAGRREAVLGRRNIAAGQPILCYQRRDEHRRSPG